MLVVRRDQLGLGDARLDAVIAGGAAQAAPARSLAAQIAPQSEQVSSCRSASIMVCWFQVTARVLFQTKA